MLASKTAGQQKRLPALHQGKSRADRAGISKRGLSSPSSASFNQRYLGNSHMLAVSDAEPLIQRNCACGGGCSGSCGTLDEAGSGGGRDPGLIQRQTAAAADEEGSEEMSELEQEEEEEAGPWFSMGVQLKRLIVGKPGDAYEQEADRIADKVMRQDTDPLAALYRSHPDVPLATDPLRIRRVSKSPSPGTVDLDLAKGAGKPLEQRLQRDMESRFGYSFGNVRLHDDTESHEWARSLNARAFTVGSDIHFARGEYDPHSGDGKRLLAHELTHVVQQGNAEPRHTRDDRQIIPIDTIHRAVQRGHIDPDKLAQLPQERVDGPTETTTMRRDFQFRPPEPRVMRQVDSRASRPMIQMSNGNPGAGTTVRAEADFHQQHIPSYRATAWVEAMMDGSGCKFVAGSITPDKRMVGGFTVSVGIVTERETPYQEDDSGCPGNDGKRDALRYYVHFAAVQGIGVSISKTAGVSGTWITAQHNHTADLRIRADGRGEVKASSRRTKGFRGDRITRNVSVVSPRLQDERSDVVRF